MEPKSNAKRRHQGAPTQAPASRRQASVASRRITAQKATRWATADIRHTPIKADAGVY